MTPRNTICLWYDGTALDAARFYAETFPDSAVGAVHHAPGDFPSGRQGDVLTVEFTVLGVPCLGLNGGPEFKHNEAFSFQVATDDQAEPTVTGTRPSATAARTAPAAGARTGGACRGRSRRALTEAITDPDRAAARRAFDAMMEMRKIDIAAIGAARRS